MLGDSHPEERTMTDKSIIHLNRFHSSYRYRLPRLETASLSAYIPGGSTLSWSVRQNSTSKGNEGVNRPTASTARPKSHPPSGEGLRMTQWTASQQNPERRTTRVSIDLRPHRLPQPDRVLSPVSISGRRWPIYGPSVTLGYASSPIHTIPRSRGGRGWHQ